MTIVLYCSISFAFGLLLASLFFIVMNVKKEKEYVALKIKLENSNNLQDMIKQHFVRLAN